MEEKEMFRQNIQHYLEKTGFAEFRPKTAMFDMDGVIYDSMPNHARSWHKAMESIGIEMPPQDAYRYEGMRGVETIQMLFRQQRNQEISENEARILYGIKAEAFRQCQPPQLMPGIRELMQQMKQDGLQIIIVTGSAQHTLIDRLEQELEGMVSKELIVSALDVEHGKPNPEPYQKGLEKAGAKPNEAIVVENAPLGTRAGVAAGAFTVAANTGPLPDAALLGEGADLLFHSIKEFAGKWEKFITEVRDF